MTQIFVDLIQIRETKRTVTTDTDAGLRGGFSETDPKVYQGVSFGRANPSGEIFAAKDAMKATLRRHVENATSHLRRAEQIVGFLEHMVMEYESVDNVSAEDLKALLGRLDSALPPTPKPPAATGFQA